AFIGLSIPELFFALLMMFFAAKTGWFPVGGMHSLDYDDFSFGGKLLDLARHLALPALVLGLVQTAGRTRQMRANLLDVLRLEFRKSPVALAGASILAVLYLAAILADFLAPYGMTTQDLGFSYHRPTPVHWFDRGRFVGPYVQATEVVDVGRNKYAVKDPAPH